jgi:hypothetical protein
MWSDCNCALNADFKLHLNTRPRKLVWESKRKEFAMVALIKLIVGIIGGLFGLVVGLIGGVFGLVVGLLGGALGLVVTILVLGLLVAPVILLLVLIF